MRAMTPSRTGVMASKFEVVMSSKLIEAVVTDGVPSSTLATALTMMRPPASEIDLRTFVRGSQVVGTLERWRASTSSCAATSAESRAKDA